MRKQHKTGENTIIGRGDWLTSKSHLKEPEGIPEEHRNTGIDSLPQNSLRRRSLSMEALDRDAADRSK
ncbi:hypothetical protein TNCV_4691471 [Trichonephila clavipes]|nr:hypothetical protein TNCV_4691471 [Trichonephila clavipes]